MAVGRAEGLSRIMSKTDFNPENFVSKLSQGGEDDLLEMKQTIQILNEGTAQALKKNVYKNYSQFIETAKEISILESEMYQLSHMLTEQKTVMSAMLDRSLTGDKVKVNQTSEGDQKTADEESWSNLAFLLEKVEGCSTITEVPGRQLIHNGDLIELDPETYSHLQRVHAFLLNDSLMIATWLSNRRGLVRYRFQGLYELDNLAMVNVRDVGPVKNAFKILMFPNAHMYQCESSKAKRQWLDVLEETKKKKSAKDQQIRDSTVKLLEQISPVTSPTSPKSPLSDGSSPVVASETTLLMEEWVQELPEDLDMCIAQRDFEGAVDLIEKVNEYMVAFTNSAQVKEYRARIDLRTKQLTECLVKELQISPERMIRGGPRASRRAITQLIRLGKSTQACHLFLKHRSSMIRYSIRQLKFEGATTLYVKRLSALFFACLIETGKEFTKAFPTHYLCYSAFVTWSRNELQSFLTIAKRQMFGSKSKTAAVTDSIVLIRDHCIELCDIGLDLGFVFVSLILPDLEKVIIESQTQAIEVFKYRCADDSWRPMNHISKAMCDKFILEMCESGLDCIKEYIYDECWVSLTMNTAMFAKSIISLVDNFLKLKISEIVPLVVRSILKIYSFEIGHIEASLKLEQFDTDHEFILKNGQFVLDTLVLKIKERFLHYSLPIPKEITMLSAEYRRLKGLSNPPQFV